jgi:glycosyltransferase involved in cell wall biosynthesis
MKIATVNFSDVLGGAARAAYRLHQALRVEGVESLMHVVKATSDDWTVSTPSGRVSKLSNLVRPQIASAVRSLHKKDAEAPTSLALLPSNWPSRLNRSEADIVHLHWVCGEMMSVEDIARIHKPIVWTLHDMWPFAGAEHYPQDEHWRTGQFAVTQPGERFRATLDKWVWKRKRRAWKRPMSIVSPSQWLARCARQSLLMRDWPIEVVPNPIDTVKWAPLERQFARSLLGLPVEQGVKLIAFGGMGGAQAHRKGFDLLKGALTKLRGAGSRLELVIFGQTCPREPPDFGFPAHYIGHLHDDASLRALYCAADAMIVPSRMDNLPNTGVEAVACGTPVVAFDCCGLPDIVSHQENGWLAKPFDTEDLARGIQWVISNDNRHAELSRACRAMALSRFAYAAVSRKYRQVYERVLAI